MDTDKLVNAKKDEDAAIKLSDANPTNLDQQFTAHIETSSLLEAPGDGRAPPTEEPTRPDGKRRHDSLATNHGTESSSEDGLPEANVCTKNHNGHESDEQSIVNANNPCVNQHKRSARLETDENYQADDRLKELKLGPELLEMASTRAFQLRRSLTLNVNVEQNGDGENQFPGTSSVEYHPMSRRLSAENDVPVDDTGKYSPKATQASDQVTALTTYPSGEDDVRLQSSTLKPSIAINAKERTLGEIVNDRRYAGMAEFQAYLDQQKPPTVDGSTDLQRRHDSGAAEAGSGSPSSEISVPHDRN